MIRTLLLCLALLSVVLAKAQNNENLVQLSGLVLDGSQEQLGSVPYANIYIASEGRGTYTDFSGFFSIVVRQGDTIRFSAVGFETATLIVPDSLNDQRYSIVQMMSQDTINLATAVIFPWPSREHFKLEFLAMDVSSDLALSAQSNLAERRLSEARKEVLPDGNESADFFLREQARRSYYVGQMPPMNIFNPISWGQFFNAWKKGDFKKKDDE
ncbi:MAG: carboxypeptidase-like regulatory domain-containing protein [Saprospiraceae bacterium]